MKDSRYWESRLRLLRMFDELEWPEPSEEQLTQMIERAREIESWIT